MNEQSRREVDAYNAHANARNGMEVGTILKNLGYYSQGVVDAAGATKRKSEVKKIVKTKKKS